MKRTISDAVKELCLSFPDAKEKQSHGMTNFNVKDKTFATYAINHHGDGRVALWLEANSGSQALYTEIEPQHFFVPPYVGPKGWLGVDLNSGIAWQSVVKRVREAFEKVAPVGLQQLPDEVSLVDPPTDPLAPEEIDPLLASHPQEVLRKLSEICARLPETNEARQFGNPVWKAGKKTFVCVHRYYERLCIQVWVGGEQQSFLIADPRYRIPPYVGHNGWIDLDVEDVVNWKEIESLIQNSYRHFALKRMLKALGDE